MMSQRVPTHQWLNGYDVHMVVAGWHLNKIIWLINCFCSWKKSSQFKVICGNIFMNPLKIQWVTGLTVAVSN